MLGATDDIITVPSVVPETEYAWCAGLFDGEGSTYILIPNKKWKYRSIRMSIAQAVDSDNLDIPRVLQRFITVIGNIGRIYREDRTKGKMVYKWQCSANDCILVFSLLKPYLTEEKVKQYLKCLDEVKLYKKSKKTITHCKRGHLLANENLYRALDGARRCKLCREHRDNIRG